MGCKSVLPLALALLIAVSANAQQTGQIVGAVTDSSGAVVAGVAVTATESQTQYVREAVTDQTGRYVVPALRPAVYEISAEAKGFHKFVRSGVELLANQSLTINIALEVGNISETVTVSAPINQVDTSTSTLRETVDRQRIVELPLNGRNAASLTTLVPGTVIAPASAVGPGSHQNRARRAGDRFLGLAPEPGLVSPRWRR